MDLNRPTSADAPKPPAFDPWASPSPSSLDFPNSWADPSDERALMRRRLRRLSLGFSATALGLIVASLLTIGDFFLLMPGPGRMALLQLFRQCSQIGSPLIVCSTLLGAALIWGPWPDRGWLRRSGLLLIMSLTDLVLWSLQHATDLGLSEAKIGHDWLRRSLGSAIGWSEFALGASLAADMATRMGEAQALEFGRAARSLATTGAMVWSMLFYSKTYWGPPFWPLREVAFNRSTIMLLLGTEVLWAVCAVQVSALSIMASRAIGRELRRLAAEDRSEAGWDGHQPVG